MKNKPNRAAHLSFGSTVKGLVLRLFLLGFLIESSAVQAHEFWVMPKSFGVASKQDFLLELRVGAGWPGEALARNPAYIERFDLIDANGERPVGGQAGGNPAGVVTAKKAGAAWAVFRSKHSALTLEAEKFESYLREEGLESIIEARRLSGKADAPGREVYSRCAKALLRVGQAAAPSSAVLKRNTGLTLELIPQTDPQQLRGGGAFKVQVLYLNKPLQGVLVKALPQDMVNASATAQITARTDAQGRVSLPLSRGGVWLINAVHMVKAPAKFDADWESVWSSLTLELPQAPSKKTGVL